MQIVDKIFFDPITKGLKFFGKTAVQTVFSLPIFDVLFKDMTLTLTNITLGSGGINSTKYIRIGPWIILFHYLKLGTGGSVSGNMQWTLPSGFTFSSLMPGQNAGANPQNGFASGLDSTVARFTGNVFGNSSTTFQIFSNGDGGVWRAGQPFTWSANDEVNAVVFGYITELL